MSAETDLTDGVAALLQAAGIGTPGAASGTAIAAKDLNPQPDRGVAIVVGGVSDSVILPIGRRTIQLRTRGTTDARDVDALAEAAFDVLQGIHGIQMGATVLAHLFRTSFVSLGRDSHGRWERSDNYLADITTVPTANRPG